MCRFLTQVLHSPDDTAGLSYLPVRIHVNATDSVGYTYLDRAVWLGSPSAAKELLRHDANPNERGVWGRTPLHDIFNLMHHPDGAGALQALINAGADVNVMVSGSGTPLDVVISRACPPAFRIIHAKGGWATMPKIHFPYRFLRALEGTDVIIDFIEADESFGFERTQGHDNVLCCAVQRNSLKAIRRLLRLEDDSSLRDDRGHTPFHYSAELIGHPGGRQGLLALVKEGYSINATNKDGISALQLAVAKSSCLAVQFLLEQGADLHDGSTLSAVSPQFAVTMLEHPDGIAMMLKLVRAGMAVEDAPSYRMKVRSRVSSFWVVLTCSDRPQATFSAGLLGPTLHIGMFGL
ncbi:hypothetical protein BOTBODRAFT_559221 [Botryobasidium botryosum FD-172 SS1]|uniref:Uncharacterized protein n=1 Tax=Botryobasidium botryosum (strain FD-172 SS1) TaxID=930990 RepID=A0A067M2A4_BOTB1|nr:hypothetical protein BOTBODRAFT_559221 [Botryobasidium botryosum FD-172 SS1]